MKFFDVLPQLAENELLKRGVMTDELLYCVKADLDGEGVVPYRCDRVGFSSIP